MRIDYGMVEEPEGETYCDRIIEEYAEKFQDLLDQASNAGVKAIIVCNIHDELNTRLDMRIMASGGYVQQAGMAAYATEVFRRQLIKYSNYIFEDED